MRLRPRRRASAPSTRRGRAAAWCWWRDPTSPAPTATGRWPTADHRERGCAATALRAHRRAGGRAARGGRPGARLGPGRGAVPPPRARCTSPWPALRAPDVEPGLLRSASTRRTGLVTLVDIAPTILDLAGVERPASMEGRRFERGRGRRRRPARSGPPTSPRSTRRPATATGWWRRWRSPSSCSRPCSGSAPRRAPPRRARGPRAWSALAALAMLAYLPATYLAGLDRLPRPRRRRRTGSSCSAVAVGARRSLADGHRRGRRCSTRCSSCLGAVFGLLAVDMLIGAPLQLNTVFGYSPTVGGRFAGHGQPRLRAVRRGRVPALRPAVAPARRSQRRRRRRRSACWWWPSSSTACRSGAPTSVACWPSCPRSGVTAAAAARPPRAVAARWSCGAASALAVVGLFAAARPDPAGRPSAPTSAGSSRRSADQGVGALETVVTRKLGANFAVITSSVWTAMVPIALGFIVYLLWRRRATCSRSATRSTRASPGSPWSASSASRSTTRASRCPGVMLGVVNASLVYLTVRTPAAESSSRDRRARPRGVGPASRSWPGWRWRLRPWPRRRSVPDDRRVVVLSVPGSHAGRTSRRPELPNLRALARPGAPSPTSPRG